MEPGSSPLGEGWGEGKAGCRLRIANLLRSILAAYRHGTALPCIPPGLSPSWGRSGLGAVPCP